MSLIVFGSINLDLVAKTPRLPLAGETILGHHFYQSPGGKGANQAVATARLGVKTYLIGRVGNDSFGQDLLTHLEKNGVDTKGVTIDSDSHSGVAIIAVDDRGENNIIVVPGANGKVGQTETQTFADLLSDTTALLLQLEIPLPAVQTAAAMAREAGVKVILDPAPVRLDMPDSLYPYIDILTPNEIEASQLVGFTVNSPETATQAATQLRDRGVHTVIVKLGDRGAVCATPEETFLIPAFSIQAIDTVAAGDAFNGGLAVALDSGLSLREALVWGSAAGALCATQPGAQTAMPDRATFDAFLQNRG